MCHVDVIYILHQLSSSLLTNIFVQSTAKIIGNVIFTIRECASAAETAHNRAGLTLNAGFHLFTVDWAVTLL